MHQKAAQTATKVCLPKIPGDIRLTARRGGEGRWTEKHVCEGEKYSRRICACAAFMLLKRITAAKLNKRKDKKLDILNGGSGFSLFFQK